MVELGVGVKRKLIWLEPMVKRNPKAPDGKVTENQAEVEKPPREGMTPNLMERRGSLECSN